MAKILLVDDSMVARMSVKSCIPKDEGHEVFEASDGAKGLEMFRKVLPDVTFLDLTMPDINGMMVLEELKGEFPDAIFIVLSADIQKKTRERISELGAFAMIGKPPVKESVRGELARAISTLEGRNAS